MNGSDTGIGTLFEEHAPMVLAICRYHLRDPQAAEDAAQDTFLSAHRSLLGGTEPRDPAAWLATIARNRCRRMRSTTSTAWIEGRASSTPLDPADIVVDRAHFSDLAGAITELPDRQREALVLRELWGLSYDQVAAAMGVSGAAVDSLLSRARRHLAAKLGHIPKTARGALVVPASLRDELGRLIPELGGGGTASAAGAASGAGGAAALASLGAMPIGAKVAATGAAAVVLALPVQATSSSDEGRRAGQQAQAGVQAKPDRTPWRAGTQPDTRAPAGSPDASEPGAYVHKPAPADKATGRKSLVQPPPKPAEEHDYGTTSSGPGSGSGGSSGSSSGGGDWANAESPTQSGPGSGSSGSSDSGSGSGRSGPTSSGSGSGSGEVGDSGSGGLSGPGSGSSGTGSGDSGQGSSGSGSSGSGSGSSGSGSSGSGSGDSGSGDSGSGDAGGSDDEEEGG